MQAVVARDESVKLVPCDVCGVHKVAVEASFDGDDFVACDVCTGEGDADTRDTIPCLSTVPPVEQWADVCLVCGEPGEIDDEGTCSDACRATHRRLVATECAVDQDLSDRASEVFS